MLSTQKSLTMGLHKWLEEFVRSVGDTQVCSQPDTESSLVAVAKSARITSKLHRDRSNS